MSNVDVSSAPSHLQAAAIASASALYVTWIDRSKRQFPSNDQAAKKVVDLATVILLELKARDYWE
jgi:hypothetical protein